MRQRTSQFSPLVSARAPWQGAPLAWQPPLNFPDALEAPPLRGSRGNQLEAAGASHIGYVRQTNQDRFYLNTQIRQRPCSTQSLRGIFVLCDGIGGGQQGDVASTMATFSLAQTLLQYPADLVPTELHLKSALYTANRLLHQENLDSKALGISQMGTTAVVALVQDLQFSLVHVGDSRCYRVTRTRGLEQMTTDHRIAQGSHGADPAQAHVHPQAHRLTQALGPRPNSMISPDVLTLDVEEDSLFLLCTDGLSDQDFIEDCWESRLMPYLDPAQSLAWGVSELLHHGLCRNGHDNLTALLLRLCP
ncbi:protein phosphatase 2C domain-containing protein [Lyngbya confervoides]|uniref:Protein phosphatase 2C domain-containing protein n=1 Tax=Lyngbya confervoides BDU141951 TaxID=1574623 RepID=A0ABD4T7Y0_9CYAN|nr:protein phosphatase 2C domain-containing protein [Lyngbya confervoides]MCM1984583.1 protein phosphatase 2C domain-containing protein [Lyngbya confervoides BDU141951]